MELKEGMYVKTQFGTIAKIEQIVDDEIHINIKPIFNDGECLGYEWFYIKDVIKSSNYLIDLIETGDYVNGVKVIDKEFDNLNKEYLQCGVGDYVVCTYEAKDIKTVVTKEQFENGQYKVGE